MSEQESTESIACASVLTPEPHRWLSCVKWPDTAGIHQALPTTAVTAYHRNRLSLRSPVVSSPDCST
jgi:hypothetical protein